MPKATNAGEAAAAFREMSRAFPHRVRGALSTLARTIKARTGHQIRKGAAPLSFAPLSKITLALRGRRGLRGTARGKAFGGKLSRSIKTWVTKDSAKIGWPDGLKKHGQSFQSAERHRFDKSTRAMLYRNLLGKSAFIKGDTRLESLVKEIEFATGLKKRKKSRRKTPPVELQYYDRPARKVWPVLQGSGKLSDESFRIMTGAIKAMVDKAAAKVAQQGIGSV